MASTLLSSISMVIKAVRTFTDTVTNGSASGPLTSKITYEPAAWTDGTTASKADLEWQDTRTLNSTSETLDLTALTHTLTGTTINFAEIILVYIRPDTTTTAQTVVWGNAASNSFQGGMTASATETVQAGGCTLRVAPVDGWTTSSASNLKVTTNYSGTYTIKIIGRSA